MGRTMAGHVDVGALHRPGVDDQAARRSRSTRASKPASRLTRVSRDFVT